MKINSTKRIAAALLILACCGLSAGTAWAQAQGAARTTTTTYPSSTQVGEAMISVDTETRNLIVITDDETAAEIKKVVASLDRSPPQVLINVVFIEVTYRKGSDIGLQGGYGPVSFSSGALTGLVSQAFRNLPGLATGPGGIYTLLGEDFDVTLKALAESGKVEVLSRPTILARNNQQAVITVGQRVPLVTSVRYDNYGNQLNGVSYEDIGIILQVTPFITSDNLVEMIVAPQISTLSEQSVNISSGTNAVGAPVINIRSADTVVVTPDGQTVVIGGLMLNNKTESQNKIPLLGDIPLLGGLFRRTVKNDTKTELLIFLTPRIVKTPAELARVTSQAAGSTRLVPKAFPEDELNRYFETLPEEAPAETPATRAPTPAAPPEEPAAPPGKPLAQGAPMR